MMIKKHLFGVGFSLVGRKRSEFAIRRKRNEKWKTRTCHGDSLYSHLMIEMYGDFVPQFFLVLL